MALMLAKPVVLRGTKRSGRYGHSHAGERVMTEKPSPPPEAQLIRLVREAANMTIPAAANAAGMSKSRWSQIEGGYESRRGSVKVITAKAATIAHMAHVVGVSPGRLTEAGRPDAAEILEEILAQKPPPPEPPPRGDDDLLDALLGWAAGVRQLRERDPEAAAAEVAKVKENLRRIRERNDAGNQNSA